MMETFSHVLVPFPRAYGLVFDKSRSIRAISRRVVAVRNVLTRCYNHQPFLLVAHTHTHTHIHATNHLESQVPFTTPCSTAWGGRRRDGLENCVLNLEIILALGQQLCMVQHMHTHTNTHMHSLFLTIFLTFS